MPYLIALFADRYKNMSLQADKYKNMSQHCVCIAFLFFMDSISETLVNNRPSSARKDPVAGQAGLCRVMAAGASSAK